MVGLVTEWMDDRLRVGAECVRRATRDSETWDKPSSSSKRCEPFAQSAARGSHETCQGDVRWMSSWRSINNGRCRAGSASIDLLVQRYALLVGWLLAWSCGGSKESYIPPMPPLTRCNQDSSSRLLHQLLLNLNCEAAALVTATATRREGTGGAADHEQCHATPLRPSQHPPLPAVRPALYRQVHRPAVARRARSSSTQHQQWMPHLPT